MSQQYDVSVVVCTYNRSELLPGVLESLCRQVTDSEVTYEIVVVDNASTDNTQEVLERLTADAPIPVRVVLETSQGVAFARNRGIAEARGEWIYFIDDDELASHDCVMTMLGFARARNVRVVGGAVDVQLPDSCPADQRAVYRLLLSHTRVDDRPFRLHPKRAVGAGNLMLHRSVFDEIGCFDENLTEASEDSNLFHRIFDAGIEAWFTPDSKVYHLVCDYRISPAYARWVAQRHGWNLAREDYRRHGAAYLIACCLARLVYIAVMHLPKYVIGKVAGMPTVVFLAQCKISRAFAYARNTLRQLLPNVFPQQSFAESLDFRSERETFGSDIDSKRLTV
jgi:glycosyltransferase involved in cell wall biosynthesis